MLKTKRELATAFKASLTSVQNWTARHDFPGGRKGPWENSLVETYLRKNGLWKFARSQGSQVDTDEEAGDDESLLIQKLRAEIRKLKADGEGKEFRNRKASESVIDRKEAMQAVSELLLRIGQRLDSIPEDLEMSFPIETRQQNKEDVAHKIRSIRKEMAAWRL